jgi:hypothetical protein
MQDILRDHEARISTLAAQYLDIRDRLGRLETRVEGLDTSLNARITSLDNRINTLTIVVFGNIATTILAAVGIILAVLMRS